MTWPASRRRPRAAIPDAAGLSVASERELQPTRRVTTPAAHGRPISAAENADRDRETVR